MAILTGVKWNLSVVLMCILFMAGDGEHFFMFFLPFEFLLLRKFYLVQLPFLYWFISFGRDSPYYSQCALFCRD
jgi:hypothetical protein